jgi:glycosyltransferase involved in cell wall biosynthesis
MAVLWLVIEGAQVAQGGVAQYAANLLAEQDELRAEFAGRGIGLDFVVGEPHYRDTVPGYDLARWQRTDAWLRARGGRAVRLVSDTDGDSPWGADRFSHALSAAGAQVALDLAVDYEGVLVISTTSAFARVPGMVQRLGGDLATRILHVHTFGMATHDTRTVPTATEITADGDVAYWVRHSPRVLFGYISRYTAQLYRELYGAPADSLVPNRTGIRLADPRFEPMARDQAEAEVGGLPERGRFVVMWGRRSETTLDKGYHLLIEAAAREPGLVPVIATRRPDPSMNALAERLGVTAVFLVDQPFRVISALVQHERTVGVAFLGEAEPGAAAPMEAMWTARKSDTVMLFANAGNLPELVVDGESGLLTDRTKEAVAAGLRRLAALASPDRRSMAVAAASVIQQTCDFALTIREFLDASVSRWDALR